MKPIFNVRTIKLLLAGIMIFTCSWAMAQELGKADKYSLSVQGMTTASGEAYDSTLLTCANDNYPLGTMLRVTRIDTRQSVEVRVNDRGPLPKGVIVRLSEKAAQTLGMDADTLIRVVVKPLIPQVTVLERERLDSSSIIPGPPAKKPVKAPKKKPATQVKTPTNGAIQPVKPVEQANEELENRLWTIARQQDSPEALSEYLRQFPTGPHAEEAATRLSELTVTTTQPDTAPAVDQKAQIEQFIANHRGRLLYYIPDTMQLLEQERVGVKITSDTTIKALQELVESYELFQKNREQTQTVIIRIGEKMRVTLEDPSPKGLEKFLIQPVGSSDRPVDLRSAEASIWEWYVTPKVKGRHKLIFSISILITKENGQEETFAIPVREVQVTVVVQPNFWRSNWPWLVGGFVLLAGAAAFILFQVRRRKQQAIQLALPFDELRELIRFNRIDEVFTRLNEGLKGKDEERLEEAILLQTRWERNEENFRRGVLTNEEADLERNKITNGLLDLLQALQK